MLAVKSRSSAGHPATATSQWPAEARALLEAMSGGPGRMASRRSLERYGYHVKGTVELTGGNPAAPISIYTRDIHEQALGFLSGAGLPVGSTGAVTLPGPNGESLRITFSVLRCRHVGPNWHEGCLFFAESQSAFSSDNLHPR